MADLLSGRDAGRYGELAHATATDNTAEIVANISDLVAIIGDASVQAKAKLAEIKARGDAISIADMFDMQMLMNHLSQLSEMSTSVVSAANASITSMARNIK